MKELRYDYKQLYKKCTGDPKQDLIRLFPKQFEGIGLLPKEYDIDMKLHVVPVQLPVKKELDHLEKLEIISRVTKATECCNNLVYINKPNEKLCLDTCTINCHIVSHPHYNSNFNDILMTPN